ncbi:MAG: hypothetical protein QOG99_2661 [Frankiales bacterium]|jgi:steroid delta-isomerase-like uncharacterized protein|nr:hypothetical protein [Frankiales bacterium]
MHYNFGIKWLKAFRSSAEEVCALYEDGFVFEDVMLDQHNINTKPDLLRTFAPYANKDPENGVGIHNFKIRSYVGDAQSGLLRWEWSPEHAGSFLGLDVAGKPFQTQGHTFHMYNEAGRIVRESSWWDASQVVRSTQDWKPTKSVTNTKPAGALSAVGSYTTAASAQEHAQRWCAALGSSTAALADLYADWFTLEHTFVDDHEVDTITDRDMLNNALGGIAGGENGSYAFTAREVFEGNGHLLIHWNVEISGAKTFRGLEVPAGTTLTTIGSTFHELDGDGKVLLESTYWEDNNIFVQLGKPIIRPHYWDEDFDMEAFVASLG